MTPAREGGCGTAPDYSFRLSKPGDYVLLHAEMDSIVAFSASAQDMIPINGVDLEPTEAHFTIIG